MKDLEVNFIQLLIAFRKYQKNSKKNKEGKSKYYFEELDDNKCQNIKLKKVEIYFIDEDYIDDTCIEYGKNS